MKRWKKIVLVISTVAVLFVSVFAVSSSALDLGEYIQADPQNTLCAVDRYGNFVSGAQYALPSFVIPPENSSGSYLTFGNMQGIKYRWQWFSGDNTRFGVHSVSYYTQYLYQSFGYLNISGIDNGGYDISVRSNVGIFDGNYGVTKPDPNYQYTVDNVEIILDVVYTYGYSAEITEHYDYTGQRLHFTNLRSDKIYMVSDLVESALGNPIEVYLRSISVRSGRFDMSGDTSTANELFVLLYTDGYRYWDERTNPEAPFTSEIDELRYTAWLNGRDVGYEDGYQWGLTEGSEAGYNAGYNDGLFHGEQVGYDIGYEEGYQTGYANNILVNDGIFSWIVNACEGFLSFEIFPNFSFGLVLSLVAGLSILIYILKVVAGG